MEGREIKGGRGMKLRHEQKIDSIVGRRQRGTDKERKVKGSQNRSRDKRKMRGKNKRERK